MSYNTNVENLKEECANELCEDTSVQIWVPKLSEREELVLGRFFLLPHANTGKENHGKLESR